MGVVYGDRFSSSCDVYAGLRSSVLDLGLRNTVKKTFNTAIGEKTDLRFEFLDSD
jgi:hypothetical protein